MEHNGSLFTCLSCSIAFHSAEDQREHYKSDHHRYNMKRRVAGLPPLSVVMFNQKVLERRAETAIMASPKGSTCEVCGKSYTTENAYRSHINSRKHKENELKAAAKAKVQHAPEPLREDTPMETSPAPVPAEKGVETQPSTSQPPPAVLKVDDSASEEQVNQTIDEKIAAARARLSTSQCLFCSSTSSTLDANLEHMLLAHSFFIPDTEYLVDLPGLLTYLGEKIAVGNVCIYCNGRGREFRTLDAVRKHMLDKGHCKIAYDSEEDRLEVSDYYDFTASYPDAEQRRERKAQHAAPKQTPKAALGEEEWVDTDDEDGEADEIVDADMDSASDASDDSFENQITYGDSHYELVLPTGARIGHRSLRRYYAQSFPRTPRGGKQEDPNSGAALVRRLLADKKSALVPVRGGFGAFGAGTEVVKARNRGEAKEAGRHVREFRDQRRREEFKTRVAFIHNHQKHFRDPLLQVRLLLANISPILMVVLHHSEHGPFGLKRMSYSVSYNLMVAYGTMNV
ncbi:cytoplasmic protein [Wolfiporia cocos MD-104 SS10]|uniref:Cytoplasmic protein n=1 Tax=Wolfiporia cocos (strain MD-104) TaxID=742152 RepID=A0A2H3JNF4_WOLCO|nr:cytoplasmic protein [Wolfiporia cocos MD-104 SS10]